jgi:formylglycine-generating enzyme required for sulfatase activity
VYAYGDRYEAGLCPPSGDRPNYRVDAHPACVSGYGVFGLSGGVAEWTATRRGRGYVVKPGDVADDHRGTRCGGRSDRPPDFRQIHLGFRCCSDP